MRKFLAILLFGLMCVQLLPIKEVGKLLFNNQIVEEHIDGGCSSKSPVKLVKDFHLNYTEQGSLYDPRFTLISGGHQYFEHLPPNPIQEIQTPPPNFLAIA
ncbi:hypothetical protein COR50_05140 [Chitinophaga caeni]|uniref:Uncharacterized protein n=1 Tax=Chitinophaga caeni TaxID=2029983 RepID=A0A291QRR4_9BACT|nr:hypothetical protein [Chitinophaga caeni]ATL46616.1 hypothetical protein COR50_05140 [Chitinophaga caeni]